MAYPIKLRGCALQTVRKGHPKTEVREMFGLGKNTLMDWEHLKAETGSLKNRPLNRTVYKIDREKLLQWYCDNPYSMNKETEIAFSCSISGICGARKVLRITHKKHH